jgi:membrane protein implicated in regulation of membrane protease activity
VARAKRTERAEARRRYRAAQGEVLDDEVLDADGEPVATTSSPPAGAARGSGGRASQPPPQRASIGYAFRSSFTPLDLRGDLRALPRLLIAPSFLIGVAITAAAAFAIPVFGSNGATITLYQYFSGPEPLGTAFIVGFFAARASYLLGGIIAVLSIAFQAIAIAVGGYDAAAATAAEPLTRAAILGQLPFQLVVSVPMSAFFAAAAAWYRRFLRRASPNRQPQQASSARRPDGKVPKKSSQRPLLARKR